MTKRKSNKKASKKPRRWHISVANTSSAKLFRKEKIILFMRRCLKLLNTKRIPSSVSEVSILFTADSQIRKLNREYRNIDKATDVLSFSQIEDLKNRDLPPKILGDIVISTQTAKRDAKANSETFEEVIKALLVHGLLHLFGYEHENVPARTANSMFKTQAQLLTKLKRISLIK